MSDLPKFAVSRSAAVAQFLAHQKVPKVKVNAGFLSFKSQLPPSYETETVERISMLPIIDASSNLQMLLAHIASMLHNFVTNFGISICHLQHKKHHQSIMYADAYAWAKAQVKY